MAFFETAALLYLITSLVVSVAITIYIAYLIWSELISWFRRVLARLSYRMVSFLFRKKWRNGDYKVIQGVLNPNTEELEDARIVNSDSVDSRVASELNNNELVIVN
jgi:hypothetical protein